MQGCCLSRSAGPNSPYPGGAPNASARHINPPPLSLGESLQASNRAAYHSNRTPQRRRTRDQGPLDEHINKPLRRHVWASVDKQWTRKELDRERADFFDTRVTGRPEIWQTLHAALQVLWETSMQEREQDDLSALETAQTILTAAEISLPTGNLVNGAYDSFGNYYSLPEWAVSDPQDIMQGEGDKEEIPTGARDSDEEGYDTAGLTDSENQKRRGEKGKGVVDTREQIKLCARLSETGQDITVIVDRADTVKAVLRAIDSASAVCFPSTLAFLQIRDYILWHKLTLFLSFHQKKRFDSLTWAKY